MGVMIKEVFMPENDNGSYIKVAIFTYKGEDDPVEHIDNAVSQYTNGYKINEYYEYVDINMDNPWVRMVTVELSKDEMRDNKLKGICGI